MVLTETAPLVQHDSLGSGGPAEDLAFLDESDPLSRSFSVVLSPRERDDENSKLTAFETFVTFIKGNTGPGFLSIPFAFSLVGLVLGPPALTFVAGLCYYCMLLLLRCADHLAVKTSKAAPTYGDVLQYAFKGKFGGTGQTGRRLVNGCIILTQFGFCSVYFGVISTNIKTVVDSYEARLALIDVKVYMILILTPIMMTTFIWNIKSLAWVSVGGTISILAGITITIVYSCIHASFHDLSPLYFGNPRNIPIFFGMAIYSFEGICWILPLKNEMKEPRKFPLVLSWGMLSILLGQIFLGVVAYICFKETTLGVITFSMGNTGVLGIIAIISVALCVYFTYPIMFYIPIEAMLPFFLDLLSTFLSPYSIHFWLRTTFVLVTCFLAIVIPHVDLFIALIGAFACTALALIFPPIAYLLMFKPKRWEKAFCYFILTFGTLGAVSGTFFASKDIVCALSGLPVGGSFPCKEP